MIYSIIIGGRNVLWRMEHSSRLKKIHVQVHPQEGVIVWAPLGYTVQAVAKALAGQREWLAASIAEITRRCPPREYGDAQKLPCLGREVVMRLHTAHGRIYGRWEGDRIDIFLVSQEQTRDRVRDCLCQLYLAKAKNWFPPRVDELNRQFFQRQVNRVAVKGQSNILGSCSSLSNLNFNWRLLLAPVSVADYVIIHELAHLVEMNHSPRFWQLVADACPHYQEHLAWLRSMSATLYI